MSLGSAFVFGMIGLAAALSPYPQATTSLLTCALGAFVFYTHGRQQITGAGLYALASVAFVGYPGVYWSTKRVEVTGAVLIGFWTLLFMSALWWRSNRSPSHVAIQARVQTSTWGMTCGLVIALVGPPLARSLDLVNLGGSLALGGLSLFLTSLMVHRGRVGAVRYLLAAAAVAYYWIVDFTGFGRLLIVALALIVAVLASGRTRTPLVKTAVLTVSAPVTLALVRVREAFGAATTEAGLDGLGSVVAPLATLQRLLDLATSIPSGQGSTFVASFLVWMPRSLWPTKPDGFGTTLTAKLEPALLPLGHSMAAHSGGEWFYNFGYFGLVLMVLVLGVLIRLLDDGLLSLSTGAVNSRRRLLMVLFLVVAIASVPTLMWAGTFTFVSRVLQQAVLPGLVVALWASREPRAAGEGMVTRAGPHIEPTDHDVVQSVRARRT